MKLTEQRRFTQLAPDEAKTERRTLRLSFSSETPVSRFFGNEILVHDGVAPRMARLNSRAPLLFNHNMNDVIGVVERAEIKDKRGYATVRFAQTPRGDEVLSMIRDNVLSNVSFMYRILEAEQRDDDFIVTSWEPAEISIVSVPADTSVGVGRMGQEFEVRMMTRETGPPVLPTDAGPSGATQATTEARSTRASSSLASAKTNVSTPAVPAKPKEPSMADESAAAGESADQTAVTRSAAEVRVEVGRQEADKNFAAEQERKRQQAIRNLATANSVGDDTVQNWIARGMSLDQVADDILAIHKERGKTAPRSISALGLTDRESGQYSLCRAILAARDNDWRKAGFELECHRTIADKTDKPQQNHCFYIPLEVQRRQSPVNYAQLAERHSQPQWIQRDLNVANGGAGGYLVQTSVMGFDELLRNLSFAFRMGATRLTGLRDNVTIPRQSAAATAEWLTSETGAATESQPTFVQLAMTPKTVSAYTELSRKLLMQSSIDVEGLVNADLAAVAALAVDVAVISGTGTSGQPLGIDNVTGVGSVSGSSLGLAGLLETQTDLAAANIMPMRGGYVTTPSVAALMIAEVLYANTASPAWVGNVWSGSILGFPAMSTNQVAAATMYFGAWENCVVGEWGVLEIDTNPYANFGAGIIGVRAMYSVDVGIRRPAAFTIATSIT